MTDDPTAREATSAPANANSVADAIANGHTTGPATANSVADAIDALGKK